MFLSDMSVKRPVLAFVMSALLLAFGLISFDRMSLREYPNIDRPIVTIDTRYTGASATVVENRITKLIENRIAGVNGIKFISSSSQDGRSKITVEFSLDRDIDAAANDLRDRVSKVLDNLPEEADPPEVEKADGDESVIMWFNLASDRMSVTELTDYAERYLVDQFSVLDGVARVRVGGGQSYALRIWLDPLKLASYGIAIATVEQRLREANVELPAGNLQGINTMLTVQVQKPFSSVAEIENLVIENVGAAQIRLNEIARVQLGAIETRRVFRGNGVPMVGIGIIKQSTANTLSVAERAKAQKARVNQILPEGMALEDSYDASVFVQSAVSEVYKTLFIALGLVTLVMILFLRSFKTALIPLITLPISILATFWLLYQFGFTINLLTLLALVLAIGLVVDDAIVVLENIQRHIEQGHHPLTASYLGARQVGFAVIATTLVLISVFMPIGFLEGNVGRLFTEFAVTLSVAVLFSSWVALTLSPALASKILSAKKPSAKTVKPLFSKKFNTLLSYNLRYPWIIFAAFALIIVGLVWQAPQVKQELVPKEDRGAFFISVKGPEGASFEYMNQYMEEIERRLTPWVDKGYAKRLLIRSPRAFGNAQVFNTGFVIIVLEDWSKRPDAQVLMKQARAKLKDLTGVKMGINMRSGIGGKVQKPVQFVISGSSYEQLEQWQQIMSQAINKDNPGFISGDWDYNPNKPQLKLNIDYDQASVLGIDQKTLSETLQVLLGSKTVTTFPFKGEEVDILLEAEHQELMSPQDLANIYLPSDSGQMVSLGQFVTFEQFAAPASLRRYNRMRSITFSANLQDNLSLDEALQHLQKLVRQNLPAEAVISYRGQSLEFQESSSNLQFTFIFALSVIFLVLAAQFESFKSPLIIMLSVPLALAGGLLAMQFYSISLNIFSQIALILLLGLATKNGILIVEFANQLRDQGKSLYHALIQATQQRLRPILMTTITTCVGAIPLILSSGAGAETRQILGYILLWGVAFSTLLSLFFIPALYALMAKNVHAPQYTSRRLQRLLQQESKNHKNNDSLGNQE